MRKLFQDFRSEESGATLVEYGVALVVAIIVGGTALATLAGSVSDTMGEAGEVCGLNITAGDTGCPTG